MSLRGRKPQIVPEGVVTPAIGGFGADSGPSVGDPFRRAIRPIATSKAGGLLCPPNVGHFGRTR